MRIVSLVPNGTEILFALGAGELVVGVSHECDYPPAARTRPVLTGSALSAGMSAAGWTPRWRPRWAAAPADIARSADAEAMVRAAEERFGRLDVLFNNAGISHPKNDDAVATEEEGEPPIL